MSANYTRESDHCGKKCSNPILMGACGIAIPAFWAAQDFQRQLEVNPRVAKAHETSVPEALLALVDAEFVDPGAVFLTDYEEIAYYRPQFLFNSFGVYFAHPAAAFAERSEFIHLLSSLQDPAAVSIAVQHNRLDHVDAVLMHRTADGSLSYKYSADNFPYGTVTVEVLFSPGQFGGPTWTNTSDGEFTLYRPVSISADELSLCTGTLEVSTKNATRFTLRAISFSASKTTKPELLLRFRRIPIRGAEGI